MSGLLTDADLERDWNKLVREAKERPGMATVPVDRATFLYAARTIVKLRELLTQDMFAVRPPEGGSI